MFLQGSAESWHWSTDVEPGVNFCVWALQADGLRVPPFDQHPEGDGSLRVVGLTPLTWRAWLAEVFNCRQQISDSPFPPPRALVESIFAPASLWRGDLAVGARLADLWPGYAAQADAWKRHYALEADPTRLAPTAHHRLWQQLAPYRRQLPPLRFFLVEYPQVVLDVIPPETALIGTGAGALDPSSYTTAVLRTAELLAQAPLNPGDAPMAR
ncbi:MAG: hypothetical protein ACR2JY_05130 [Chloroflexota bacterium]